MLKRIARIFRRYADEYLETELSGFEVLDRQGHVLATVEKVALRRNRLHVIGHGAAEAIAVSFDRQPQWTVLASGSFEVDVPMECGEFWVLLRANGTVVSHLVQGFSSSGLARQRTLLWGRFLLTLMRLAPHIWRWKRTGDLGAREVVKERLRLVPEARALPLSSDLVLKSAGATPAQSPMATLIMPVYNAYDLLGDALNRVGRHSGSKWRLILVDDCSTDARVRPFLRDWAACQSAQVVLLQNDQNLGFIKSVNRALKLAQDWPEDPVVLLNSDALVPSGWLDRLLAPLTFPNVASVTPLSNDAEIFSAPVICQKNVLTAGQVDNLDSIVSGFDPALSLAEAPTGVGFCMAMAPQFLSKIPTFDEAFGKGYGEESDWCQKARALGGRHLCAGNLFVEHRGGESFGSAAKQRILERNGQLISKRYPAYDEEVQQFIAEDPLNTARLALAVAWAGDQRNGAVSIYLAHAMGGGAEHYLQKRIQEDIAACGRAIVLRVGLAARWCIEVHCRNGVTQGRTDDTVLMMALLKQAHAAKVVYSCGVGDRNAIDLPDVLLRLAAEQAPNKKGADIEVLCHDYFMVSPSYTLLGDDGQYHGVPFPKAAAGRGLVHRYCGNSGECYDLSQWQSAWGRLMRETQRIVVFSKNSRALLIEVYPEVAERLVVQPHELVHVPPVLPRHSVPAKLPLTIGVLGNIGLHKGALVLQNLSRDLRKTDGARLVVLGHLAPEARLSSPSIVHGAYEWRDLSDLVVRYGIDMWFMPSIWPETFSFTTHEMLATGLPVVAFDLGAQGEAVSFSAAKGERGIVIPCELAFSKDLAERLIVLGKEAFK